MLWSFKFSSFVVCEHLAGNRREKLVSLSLSLPSSLYLTSGWRVTCQLAPSVVSVIEHVAVYVDSRTFAVSGAS